MSEARAHGYVLDEGTMQLRDMNQEYWSTPLYSPLDRPDIVGRMPYYVDVEDERNQWAETVTRAMFHLTEEYDLSFSGIGNSIPETGTIDGQAPDLITYTTTRFVDGRNIRKQLSEIPIEISVGALDKILNYYEDMVKDPSERLYLTDLSLKQIMYGRLVVIKGEPESQLDTSVIDIDLDDDLSNRQTALELVKDPEKRNPFLDAIWGLIGDIRGLEHTFAQHSFTEQKERLVAVATALNINIEVPTSERW
jgi:hypothetical protein